MPQAYRQPGVRVSETVTPQVSPLVAAPADVALVGRARGYQVKTDQFALTGTSAIPLPGLPTGATVTAVDSVKDALDPSKGQANGNGYTVTTDYTVSTANGTITRVGGGGIADGAVVNVTYRYVAVDYWDPIRLFDMAAVEERFGPSVTTAGNAINSHLSYAASIAFENGAPSVVCQPLFRRTTPGDPTSARADVDDTQAAALSSWTDTLFVLRDIEDINILVPVVGQSQPNVGDATWLSIVQTFQDHVQYMKSNDQHMIVVAGEDSSASNTVAQKATLRTHAVTLAGRYGGAVAENTVFISPSKFRRAFPAYGVTGFVGGQFVAAAIAGMIASRPVSSSLTKKSLSGFVEVVPWASGFSRQDQDTDAASGLMVVSQNRGLITVRHSVTTATDSSARRELSVVRAKHRLIESVRDTLDRQIIGNLIADENAPFIVSSAVAGVLAELLQMRDIVDYTAPSARLMSLEPTTIQVKFSYRPAFPVNYIDVSFSLDLTTQTITDNAATV
jgi:hypothetical protein